jgi:Ca-activated chloride channel homolog
MSLAWPVALITLLLVPLAVFGYTRLERRRAARVAKLAAQGLVPTATSSATKKRRHLPFALMMAALSTLAIAMARPQANVSLPKRQGTVILAFDVSNSMRADDLKPNRMDAARAAAKLFVEKQPAQIRIGIVAFSDGGVVTQTPTLERAEAVAALDRLSTEGGTSLGQGIFTSLTAIAGKPITSTTDSSGPIAPGDGGPPRPPTPAEGETGTSIDPTALDIGFYGKANAIVLLSDGENTGDPDPVEMSKLSAVAGVRIFTIGIGSPEGSVVSVDGFNLSTALNEELLTEIATVSDGEYFRAADTESLNKVYEGIDLEFVREDAKTELTGLFAAGAALFLVLGAALSLLWFGRVL